MKHLSLKTASYVLLTSTIMAAPTLGFSAEPPAYATYQPIANASPTKEARTQVASQLATNTGLTKSQATTLSNGLANGNVQRAATSVAKKEARTQVASQLATNTGLTKSQATTLSNGLANGNVQRAATSVATKEATSGLASATGLTTGQTAMLTNGIKNGNLEQVATTKATNAVRNEASNGLASATGISRGDANGIVNSVRNGNIEQTATKLVTKEATKEIASATGLSKGLVGGALGGLTGGKSLFGGRGGEATSKNFIQKNDYVAATDDGQIHYGFNKSASLSSQLEKLGVGAATKLVLGANGDIKNASGELVARMSSNGELTDAAGKIIPSNTLDAKRIKETIAQTLPPQTVNEPTTADNSGIPKGFGSSAWDDATRKKAWDSLPPAQQMAWVKEAAVKANATTGGYRIEPGSNQILNAEGKVVGRLSPSAVSQFADASGTPITPNSPLYDTFKQLTVTR